MSIIDDSEQVAELADLGFVAFTTTRAVGTFGVAGQEPVAEVMGRWYALRRELGAYARRFATAGQVHGNRVVTHEGDWRGWLRTEDADGHFAPRPGTALAVTIADCVPIFIAHTSGAALALHSGWRGTAAGILGVGLDGLVASGHDLANAHVHLGPAICGGCYEVSADVYRQLTGTDPGAPKTVDLRAIIAGQARERGVGNVSTSRFCTRCDNDRFFSHRAGDPGRQLAVIVRAQ